MPKRDPIHSIPPDLPCGCPSKITNAARSPLRLSDGSRVCREHRRRFKLTFLELPMPEEVPSA